MTLLSALQEDKPALQSRIASLAATQSILKKEKKRLKAEYAQMKAKLRKQAATIDAHRSKYPSTAGVEDLQQRLVDIYSKQLSIDSTLRGIRDQLVDVKPEERQIYETQLVVLQVRLSQLSKAGPLNKYTSIPWGTFVRRRLPSCAGWQGFSTGSCLLTNASAEYSLQSIRKNIPGHAHLPTGKHIINPLDCTAVHGHY